MQPLRELRRIAVIGAGTTGRDFALRCVRAGFDLTLEDVMPSRLRSAAAMATVQQTLAAEALSGALHLASTVEEAVRDADLAIDFVPDELESKLEIFSMIDRMAPPRTVLCTPSDALSITDLASCTYRPTRCFAVRGSLTTPGSLRLLHPPTADPAVLSAVADFFTQLRFSPVPESDPDAPMLMKNLVGK